MNGPRTASVLQAHPDGCVQAALATLLCLPISVVPRFDEEANLGKNQYGLVRSWLRDRGLGLQSLHGERHWEGRYIACGTSPRQCGHAVVYEDGKLHYDPHPEGGGIAEVEETWLVYPLDIAKWEAAP